VTVQINIQPAIQEALIAKAQARGVPLESLIEEVLNKEVSASAPAPSGETSEAQSERDQRLQETLRWLAGNRSRYTGKWIALLGSRLLAVGDTGKEVYAQVAGEPVPPLVLRVEEEEPPFAGW
jgi:hypothetical protein